MSSRVYLEQNAKDEVAKEEEKRTTEDCLWISLVEMQAVIEMEEYTENRKCEHTICCGNP